MHGGDSPAIALIRQLLVALLAVVLAGACWIEQILSSDEVHPCADLKQSNSDSAWQLEAQQPHRR